jgi:choline dehydrogenase-like flavoprotein
MVGSRRVRARNWPLRYEELEPWYTYAEWLLGVAGDDRAFDGLHGAHRSGLFPMPALAESYGDQRFSAALRAAGAQVDGIPLTVTTVPQAKNSQKYDGRRRCEGRGSCIPLCPTDAKYEARIHLERALAHGAELRPRAVVTRLEADLNNQDEGPISRVWYRRWDGTEESASAPIVVLAANGIETPKLLLHSGLANRSNQVGRNLMDHPITIAWALAKEPVYPFRGPPSTSSIESLRDGPFRSTRGAFRTALRNDGWASANGAPRGNTLDPSRSSGTILGFVGGRGRFGRDLRRRLRAHASRQVLVGSSVEMLPNPDNRVTLSTAHDRFGIPRPAISFRIDGYTRAAFEAANKVHNLLFDCIGVSERHVPESTEPWTGAGHIMGTTIMGTDPTDSVVDADCRAHQHRNLYIVGSSVFPSASSANATATIAALALRAADAILRELGASPNAVDRASGARRPVTTRR